VQITTEIDGIMALLRKRAGKTDAKSFFGITTLIEWSVDEQSLLSLEIFSQINLFEDLL
jgi:hypothetical protein